MESFHYLNIKQEFYANMLYLKYNRIFITIAIKIKQGSGEIGIVEDFNFYLSDIT